MWGTRLQEEVAGLKGEFVKKAAEQQDHYEGIIRTLQQRLHGASSTQESSAKEAPRRHQEVTGQVRGSWVGT